MGSKPVNADHIAHQCGGRRYGAVTQIQDFMLHDRQIPVRHFQERVAQSLAHEILKEMPENFMVERKTPDGYPPGFYGVTEYRTDVMVFSLESFDKFVECLLKTYGDQYANAAMHSKKKALADQVQRLVHRASEAVKQASFEAGAIVEKA